MQRYLEQSDEALGHLLEVDPAETLVLFTADHA